MKALVLESIVVDVVETEFEVPGSMAWMDCSAECKAGEWEVVDGNLQAIPEPEDTRIYSDFRRNEYPEIGDQLDALFHAGVFPAEMAAEIQAVKDKYPKA
jgi:hypothetical protein